MAPLVLKYLAGSLTRHLAQMSRLTLNPSSPNWTSMYRYLSTLTTVPSRLPVLQALPHGASAQGGTSLLGQCQHLACIQPSAGMKTKSALKKRCKDCFIVRRRGRLFVICKTHPRHKQRQG